MAPELEAQNTEIEEHYTEGRYTEGIAATHEYLRQWATTRGEDSPEWCSMYSNLGPLLMMDGQPEEAEPAYRLALECTRRTFGEDSSDLGNALNNYGWFLGKLADFRRAELALEQSIRLLRSTLGEDHAYVAITLNNLALNQQQQGNDYAAEGTLRDAVARLRASLGNDHPVAAAAANNLGRLLTGRKQYEEAETLLRGALRVRQEKLGPQHRDTAIGQRDLGRLLVARGDLNAAETLFRQALQANREALGPEHYDVAMSQHELARVLWQQQRPDEAERELRESLAIRERIFEPGHSSHVQVRQELGEIAFARGDVPGALEWLRSAAEAFELSRERSGEGLDRATYLDSPWVPLAAAYLEAGDTDSAWDALHHFQGRVLEEFLEVQADPASASVEGDEALIGWLDVSVGGMPRAWAWVLRQDGPRWVQLEDQSGSSASLLGFRAGTATPGAIAALKKHGQRVYSQRIQPLEELLAGVDQLTVVPSGAMLGIPIEALVDGEGRWLMERWSISYTPSATIDAWLRQQQLTSPGPGLFLGDPPFQASTATSPQLTLSDEVVRGVAHGVREHLDQLPPLPGTRMEVDLLAQSWPQSTVLVGQDASESNLVELARSNRLRDFRVLHFATHAFVDPEDADSSTLVLAQTGLPDPLRVLETGERWIDGLVTSREILEEWQLDADLVTLSACNSALGREVGGEGFVGFAHAFLRAGARSTLVSLWSIPDRATSQFMTTFYDSWQEPGTSRVDALTHAKHALRSFEDADGRRIYEHPYYWAPFILLGDGR